MIPESEWKFFEGTEQRIKHLARHQLENAMALATGEPLSWDPAEIAARQASILQEMDYPTRVEAALDMDPTPAQARHLELHRRWVLRGLFETHPDLVPLLVSIQERTAAFRPQLADRDATRADLHRVLATETDRDTREAAYFALAPLGQALAEDVTELVRRRELLARTVTESGYPAVAFHVNEQDWSWVVGLVDAFERFSRGAFETAKGEIAERLRLPTVEPWDLDFALFGLEPKTEAAATLDPVHAARAQAERWGFDPKTIPPIREHASLPFSAWVFPVEIPGDVRILCRPGSGGEHLEHIFRTVGQTLHWSHMKSRRYFLERESPALLEASGMIFARVAADDAWLAEAMGLRGPELREYHKAHRLRRILELRRHASRTAFENVVYAESSIDPQRLYADVMEHMMQDTRRPEILWAADPWLVSAPFRRCSVVLGAMIAAQTWESMQEMSDALWQSKDAGAWLIENYFSPAAQRPWEEKVRAATGNEVGIAALARDLGVSYEGPSLTEHDEISDSAVDEYFKDIDLSDLDLD